MPAHIIDQGQAVTCCECGSLVPSCVRRKDKLHERSGARTSNVTAPNLKQILPYLILQFPRITACARSLLVCSFVDVEGHHNLSAPTMVQLLLNVSIRT
jgi:hypothetical protein